MGILRVEMRGSFGSPVREFSAQKSGHAVAVDDAIEYLRGLLESYKLMDADLRLRGAAPDDSFAEADKRGLLKGTGAEAGDGPGQ